jgi:hypothetical protein
MEFRKTILYPERGWAHSMGGRKKDGEVNSPLQRLGTISSAAEAVLHFSNFTARLQSCPPEESEWTSEKRDLGQCQ